MSDLLDHIQKLQFSDKRAAESLLLNFVRETFPQLEVKYLTLRPLAVSLNSFNGFLYLESGERLFFKTHTEPGGVIGEFYRAELLSEAGYPVLQPILQSTEAGKQILIYPYVESPSVFDIAWAIERGDQSRSGALEAAQNTLDDQLMGLYHATLHWQGAAEAETASIHQLFYHRLTAGRLDAYYRQPTSVLRLRDRTVAFSEVMNARWRINGLRYQDTLSILIEKAVQLLNPAVAGASVVGHGDAHNGNVFYHETPGSPTRMSYFDPAFAGRHHPLLDLAKPLFHNVFCMWMYFPSEVNGELRLDGTFTDNEIVLHHDFVLPPVRLMFLRSKVERVLTPTLQAMRQRGWLPDNWRAHLKAALFCCPFLTRNLLDAAIFPPNITLLGLSQAVEMCAESHGERSLIDKTLDEVERSLQ